MNKLLSILLLLISFSTFAKKQILYIGDSHSVINRKNEKAKKLGHIVISSIKKSNFELDYLAACGSRPLSWMKSSSKTTCGYFHMIGNKTKSANKSSIPKLKTTLPLRTYTQLIINFGDNMFLWKKKKLRTTREYNNKEASKLIQEVRKFRALFPNQTQCAWVGPTYNIPGRYYEKKDRHVDQFYRYLRKALKGRNCHIIDSRKLIKVTKRGDGIHHNLQTSSKWGKRIIKELRKYKILD